MPSTPENACPFEKPLADWPPEQIAAVLDGLAKHGTRRPLGKGSRFGDAWCQLAVLVDPELLTAAAAGILRLSAEIRAMKAIGT